MGDRYAFAPMGLPSPAADRTCLVTGASSGIGAEIARELARRGHGLVLVARREDLLRELASELSDAHGMRTETLAVDLLDADARQAIPGRVADLGLEVDVLVNNAGFGTVGTVAKGDAQRDVTLVRLNVETVVSLCSVYVPQMAERRRGAILNVASTAAFQPLPGQAAYAASKAFVLTYSQALHAELAGTGVAVTALCPGPVDTAFSDSAEISEAETRTMPKFFWVSPQSVAKAAVDGLAKGRGVVVPGVPNRLTAVAAQHTPRSILLPMVSRLSPFTKR